MTVNQVAGYSPTASAMGARITLAGPGCGMYLVSGRGSSPESLVRSRGGEILLRLSGQKILATLPFSGYLSLQSNRDIASIGPVTVDVKRLAKVTEMLANAAGTERGGTP